MRDLEVETGAICSNCGEKPDVLLYCYPETSWDDAKKRLGEVKKIILCHECAMHIVEVTVLRQMAKSITAALAVLPDNESTVSLNDCFEDKLLDLNYLFELTVRVDRKRNDTINLIAGTIYVGRKMDGVAKLAGYRQIPTRLEEFPTKALENLYDELLELTFDMIPRVDYTEFYNGTEDALIYDVVDYLPLQELTTEPASDDKLVTCP